jgi:hypothetical protein
LARQLIRKIADLSLSSSYRLLDEDMIRELRRHRVNAKRRIEWASAENAVVAFVRPIALSPFRPFAVSQCPPALLIIRATRLLFPAPPRLAIGYWLLVIRA